MRNRFMIVIFIGVLFLAACAKGNEEKASQITPSPTQSEEVRPQAVATNTVQPTDEVATVQESKTETPTEACTAVSFRPTPAPELVTLFSPQPGDWIYGSEDAAVTIVEYSDFQCPYCNQLAPVLDELKKAYPDDVRLIFRHFPLASIHDKALLAAQAAEAAGKQGKFWEMHDFLFANTQTWVPLSVDDFSTWLVENAPESVGLDAAQFESDLNDPTIVQIAQDAWERGQQIGIPGTPFLAINDTPYQGPTDYGSLKAIVELFKLEDRQYTSCPPMVIDPLKQYIATIETEKGNIVVELFPDIAPIAVNNFVFLAREGWYDGVTFHRVIPDFVAQAGDPTGTGLGGPGYTFINEVDESLNFDRPGLLAMANAGPDTNGSQFFITYAPAEHLNGGYTIFGEVLEGMDVLQNLTPRDPSQSNNLPPGDKIITIKIEEK